MSGREIRNWVWLALVWLGLVCGLWAGVTHGYPPAVFSMFASWVLGIVWFVADTRAAHT